MYLHPARTKQKLVLASLYNISCGYRGSLTHLFQLLERAGLLRLIHRLRRDGTSGCDGSLLGRGFWALVTEKKGFGRHKGRYDFRKRRRVVVL
jgi:hypothetical protein